MIGQLTQYVQLYSSRGPKQPEDIERFLPYARTKKLYSEILKPKPPLETKKVKEYFDSLVRFFNGK